jgi:outer membrane protein assembly factor BamE (lipoprotein component of BamABCDE complex)
MRITLAVLRRGACVLAFGTVLVALSGCLVAGSSTEKRTGKYVAETTFNQIEAGKTTAGWILATLGEPDKKTVVEDGSEVWQWQYTERRENNTAVFLLFAGSNERETTGTAFVELKDGVVTNKWRG